MNFARQRLLGAASLSSTSLVAASSISEQKEKLPIYPQPDTEIVLQEVPSELERQIGAFRRQATSTYRDAHAQVQGVVSKWIGVEHAVEHRVKSIISPEESLTPGILYVGVATLSGSIITRNRSLPLRMIFPPLLLALSANHFLPKTTHNLSEYLSTLEDHYFPTLAQKHAVANAHTAMTWERIKDATRSGRDSMYGGVVKGVDKVQEMTGLKLNETLNLAEEKKAEAQAKVVEAARAVEKKVETVKVGAETKVEKKIEEVKRLA
ncbi:hypothetical protein D9757_003854 [Collybiopsis confluens]|uniref:MICOS complex subunit n=1 Tax=Collybiopsis confluens TaxID=2823264 RepID=A0A8H5MD31_9AGAR|nr:hypothetical protein D9757_003854 [Collybiopsis confluens]